MGRKTLKERREATLPTRLSELIKNEADYEEYIDIVNTFNDVLMRKNNHCNIYKEYKKNLLDPVTSVLLDSIKLGYIWSKSINTIIFNEENSSYKEYLSMLLNTLLMEFDNSVLLLDKSIGNIETPSKYITIDDFWSDDKIDTIIEIRNKNRLRSKIYNHSIKAPIIYCFSYKEITKGCKDYYNDIEKRIQFGKDIIDRLLYLLLTKDIILIPIQTFEVPSNIKPLTIEEIRGLKIINDKSLNLICYSTTVTRVEFIGPIIYPIILKNRFGTTLAPRHHIDQ